MKNVKFWVFLSAWLLPILLFLPACQQVDPPVAPGMVKVTDACTSTFGYGTVGGNSNSETNQIHANPYTITGGVVTSLSHYASGTGNFQMAIYADNGSGTAPAGLIVASAPQAVTTTGWNTVSITPTHLDAGVYWLAQNSDASVQIYYDFIGKEMAYLDPSTFGSFPSDLSGATVCSCASISLKATYCP